MKNLIAAFFNWSAKSYPDLHLPKNTRIYSIGDIQGCYELLKQLTDCIEENVHDFIRRVVVIYLGLGFKS